MAKINKILFPVDFTESNRKVYSYVQSLVRRYQAELHLLHVTLDLEQCSGIYDMSQMQAGFQDEARQKMAELCAGDLAQCQPVCALVTCGDPALKIIEYAEQQGMDLIVMATHGRKGLEHAIFGSVAENVVRLSPVPVMTVNPHRLKE